MTENKTDLKYLPEGYELDIIKPNRNNLDISVNFIKVLEKEVESLHNLKDNNNTKDNLKNNDNTIGDTKNKAIIDDLIEDISNVYIKSAKKTLKYNYK